MGENDVRLSDMGADQDYAAYPPDVAYNSTDNEYLVVWYGDDNENGMVDDEFEIFGQLVDAATGQEIGGDVRLSNMGPDGDTHYYASQPAVAYNSVNNEYMVVWSGSDHTGALVAEEYEIYGQRVDAATGQRMGDDVRLSNMGSDGNPDYDANFAAIAYNSTENEYLVVWSGDDDTGALVEGENEIFGQRVDAATGQEIGDDVRLSDMGPDGSISYYAFYPEIAYNSTDNQYLVVWAGCDDTGELVANEFEVFGQRVDGASGAEMGNDRRFSDMGPDGDTNYVVYYPVIAYNSTDNEYLVVWSGEDNADDLVDGEIEIFAQRVTAATGDEVGTNDFRISDMGPNGDTSYGVFGSQDVAYNSTDNEYLVVWYGDDNTAPLVDNELEIFAQRLKGVDGTEVGENDIRLSRMGPDGDADYHARVPAVAYNSTSGEYLVVWYGDDNENGMVADELEIFGQRFYPAAAQIYLPLIVRRN